MTSDLDREHLACVDRRRRLVNHYDANLFSFRPALLTPEEFAEVVLDFTRWDEFRFDTVMWDINGGKACYPSRFLPHYPSLQEWLDDGNDFLSHIVSGSRDRDLEVFLSYRMNSGADPNFDQVTLKSDHEDWLIDFNEDPEAPPKRYLERLDGEIPQQKWDYANPELRAFQVAVLRELATNYDLDGLHLDFARSPPFMHVGHQWEQRDHLTAFMRDARSMMRQRAEERGRPLLLAVRIAETIEGCHFDGIDIETWVEEGLVDLLILGCRTFDVDLLAFRRLVASTPVKLYPTHDNHHSSDGYKCTPLRLLRGIASNWWHQGADGIGVFNFTCTDDTAVDSIPGLRQKPVSPCHRQDWDANRTFLSEADDPAKLAGKPKTYALQRRAGGAPWEFGYPEDGIKWDQGFQNANPFAPLPARIGQHGTDTTFFHLDVGEGTPGLEGCEGRLRVLVSDESADAGGGTDRIESGLIRRNPYVWGEGRWTVPLTGDAAERLQVRINNLPLSCSGVEEGWLVYPVRPAQLATGTNLLTLRLEGGDEAISVEKVELDLNF